jgi:hypothetical protein
MSEKMTHWFPVSIKPVHVGVYEVTRGWYSDPPIYAKWDGHCWGYFSGSILYAELFHPGKVEAVQNKQWRGFKEKQA